MTASKALFYFFLSFISGIFISSFFSFSPLWVSLIIYELLILGLFYSLFFFKEKSILVFGFCLIFLCFGFLRMEMVKDKTEIKMKQMLRNSEPTYLNLPSLKEKLRDIVFENFSLPHSSILNGIIFGDKKELSPEWKKKFNKTGISHIIAVSGMHVVILAAILIWFFIVLGLNRLQCFYFVLIALWFFIFLTSLQASAIRAGIMGSIFLIGQKIGRQSASLRALIFAAGLMLFFNPLLLKYNLGFQLSFLATLGLICLAPYLENFLERIKLLKSLELHFLLAATISAQIFLFPILVYNFGNFSLIAPLTNILIVPLLPFLMAVSLVFLLLGLIYNPLAYLISWPIHLILNYLIFIVIFFSQLPFSSLAFKIPEFFIFVYYFILALILFILQKNKKETWLESFS